MEGELGGAPPDRLFEVCQWAFLAHMYPPTHFFLTDTGCVPQVNYNWLIFKTSDFCNILSCKLHECGLMCDQTLFTTTSQHSASCAVTFICEISESIETREGGWESERLIYSRLDSNLVAIRGLDTVFPVLRSRVLCVQRMLLLAVYLPYDWDYCVILLCGLRQTTQFSLL